MSQPEIDAILTQTFADRRLSRDERKIVQQVVAELGGDAQQRALVRHRVFALAAELVRTEPPQLVLEWVEDVVKAIATAAPDDDRTARAYFSPGHDCARALVNLIARTASRLDVCVFTITDDRISDALLDAHRRGVTTRIIADNDKAFDAGSDIDRLTRQGVPVRVDQSEYHMHHKFALLDGTYLITGSYNWTRSAARYNLENFVVLEEPKLTHEYGEVFDKLWESLR